MLIMSNFCNILIKITKRRQDRRGEDKRKEKKEKKKRQLKEL